MFPTVEELREYLGDEALPPCKHYSYESNRIPTISDTISALGGSCATPLPYDPPVFESLLRQETSPISPSKDLPSIQENVVPSTPKPRPIIIHSTSSENPYFGYPVIHDHGTSAAKGPGTVRLQHSRKRKRDLIRTLFWLFVAKWRDRTAHVLYWLRHLIVKSSPKSRSSWILLLVTIIIVARYRKNIQRLHGLLISSLIKP
jgi:hypothetical protein